MGNRAVITTPEKNLALYLHWNGGRDTIEPLLAYCKMQGYRAPSSDNYGWARLTQVIGNFFGGTTSIGIDTFKNLGDQGDNGVYIIDGWEIVDHIEQAFDDDYNVSGWRKFPQSREQREHVFSDMLHSFDAAMPKELQLGAYLDAQEIPVSDVRLGDMIYMRCHETPWKAYEVVGFGDGMRNGQDVTGIPYVNKYDHDGDYSWNYNNYPSTEVVRIVPRSS